MTVLYLFLGLRGADDPAAGSAGSGGAVAGPDFTFVTLAVLLFPAMMRMSLVYSDSFRASWIFFTTPARPASVIRASVDVLTLFFLIPYLLLVAGLLVWFTRDPAFVASYVLFTGAMGHFALRAVTLKDPQLPFSRPVVKGQATGSIFGMLIVFGVIGAVLPHVAEFARRDAITFAIAVSTLAMLVYWGNRIVNRRLDRVTATFEYLG
jgi:hypothetical protein